MVSTNVKRFIKPPSSIRRGFLPDIIIYYTVYSTIDPIMLLQSSTVNPIICHEEFLSLHPMFPPNLINNVLTIIDTISNTSPACKWVDAQNIS